MRLFLSSILLIIFCFQSYSQTIRGTVSDQVTKKPVSFAAVFINGSTIGSYTDDSGNFTFKMPNNGKLPVAVSAIGYHSKLLTEYETGSTLNIFLVPKTYELNEIVVNYNMSPAERKIRKENLSTFKRQFLGDSYNAQRCEIINENDIIFRSSPGRDSLTAYAHKPLTIINKSLGYTILYNLEDFEFSPSKGWLRILGIYSFIEDRTMKGSQEYRIGKRRMEAFTGSRMHFFRALWNNSAEAEGFIIKMPENIIIIPDSIIIRGDSTSGFFNNSGKIFVRHSSDQNGSVIQLLEEKVYFNQYGYFDPLGIGWVGEMSKQRIGDLLPFDYLIK